MFTRRIDSFDWLRSWLVLNVLASDLTHRGENILLSVSRTRRLWSSLQVRLLACHCLAIVSPNKYAPQFQLVPLCSALGSTLRQHFVASRLPRASAKVTVGYTPKASRSSFFVRGRRYFMRQYLEPLGETQDTNRLHQPFYVFFRLCVSIWRALSFILGAQTHRIDMPPIMPPKRG